MTQCRTIATERCPSCDRWLDHCAADPCDDRLDAVINRLIGNGDLARHSDPRDEQEQDG